MNEFDKLIGNAKKKFDKSVKADLPKEIANTAMNFFSDSFRKQGFDDNNREAWKDVRRRTPGTPEFKYPKKKGLSRQTRPILFGNKRKKVKGSVKTELFKEVRNSIKKETFDDVILEVDTPYAKVHNEGLRAGRGSGFKMPKRKFMGNSHNLNKKIERLISRAIKVCFVK